MNHEEGIERERKNTITTYDYRGKSQAKLTTGKNLKPIDQQKCNTSIQQKLRHFCSMLGN